LVGTRRGSGAANGEINPEHRMKFHDQIEQLRSSLVLFCLMGNVNESCFSNCPTQSSEPLLDFMCGATFGISQVGWRSRWWQREHRGHSFLDVLPSRALIWYARRCL